MLCQWIDLTVRERSGHLLLCDKAKKDEEASTLKGVRVTVLQCCCALVSCEHSEGCFSAPSRRGDLEILGYCMVQWLCQKLPWENNLKNMEYVRDQKIRY